MRPSDRNSPRINVPDDAALGPGLPRRQAMVIHLWRRPEFAIGAGAIIGTNLRFWVTAWLGQDVPTTFPHSTLVINLAGSLLIGVAHTLFLECQSLPRALSLLVSVGLLGGFTTFSTFSLETVQLIEAAGATDALIYQAVSLAGAVPAVSAGFLLGRCICWLLDRRRGA